MNKEIRTGVLLVNLGTPRAPTGSAVFRYLNEFLTDGRVIDLSWIRRQLLVRGFIVPFRYRQSTEQYRRIWSDKGSPLLAHGKEVEQKLQTLLGASYQVILAMRYQFPSIQEGLEKLRQSKVEEIIILPLFPQYASATTGSVHQQVMKHLLHWEVIPKLVFIPHYFDHPSFIEAFVARSHQYPLDSYDHLLFSFHGLPERQVLKIKNTRFCYKTQCYQTALAIAQRLNLKENDYTVCFQSRLGKEPWLQPYLSDTLQTCVAKGYKKLLVFSPSFVCDCLETLFEIGHEYNKEFKKIGGEQLQLVEGLNSHSTWIEALKTIILEN